MAGNLKGTTESAGELLSNPKRSVVRVFGVGWRCFEPRER